MPGSPDVQYEVRPATQADLDVCLGIQRASVVVGYLHIFNQATHPFPDQAIRAEWAARLAGPVQVILGIVDGTASGVIGVRGDRVEALFVVPEQWGGGLSVRLHDEALARIAGAGYDEAILDVLVDNVRARRFYQRRGWVPAGEPVPSPWDPFPLMVRYRRPLSAGDLR